MATTYQLHENQSTIPLKSHSRGDYPEYVPMCAATATTKQPLNMNIETIEQP